MEKQNNLRMVEVGWGSCKKRSRDRRVDLKQAGHVGPVAHLYITHTHTTILVHFHLDRYLDGIPCSLGTSYSLCDKPYILVASNLALTV